jgi:hypothetical protein
MRATIFLLILSLIAFAPESGHATVNLVQIEGLPFLEISQSYDRDAIRIKINKSIIKRLSELENWHGDYDNLPDQKAVAIAYEHMEVNILDRFENRLDTIEPYIRRWGGGWGYDSLAAAKSGAQKQCGENCIIYLANSHAVGVDRLVDDYIKKREEYKKYQIDQFKKAQLIVLIDRAVKSPPRYGATPLTPIPFSAHDPLQIGYPDHQRDDLSWCEDLVFDGLVPVGEPEKSGYIGKLTVLEERGLYGFYKRSTFRDRNFMTSAPGKMMDSMARFTKSVGFTTNPVSKGSVILPQKLADVISGQVIRRIWVEGAVRVSDNGTPLVTDAQVAPLALQTDRKFYIGVEIHLPDEHGSCF